MKFTTTVVKMGDRKIITIPSKLANFFNLGDVVEIRLLTRPEGDNGN